MPSVRHFISPKLPTALADQKSVDVPGQDLWLRLVSHAYVVPTKLDIVTFEEALSRTLQLYPHAAGKLCRHDGRWSVKLTNTPVPVDIEYQPKATSDAFLKGDWVVQDDLSPFLSCKPIKCLPGRAVNDDDDTHLISLKLILFAHETSVGLVWHHALGDGTLVFRFMHGLSQLYQGLPLEHSSPTFDKYRFPTPSASLTDAFASRIPGFYRTWLIRESDRLQERFRENYRNLTWRFDDDELAELRSELSSRVRQDDDGYLSRQDCLSAYMVAVLNHHASEPVQEVANICSYRGMNAPFASGDVAGNMISQIGTAVPQDMAGIAAALRKALVQCREPDVVHDLMSVSSDVMLKAANAEQGIFSNESDDTLVIANSHVKIDWRSAHFGCPDGARFYKPGTFKHGLKCFRSNPTRGNDGVWQASRSVDITLTVKAELRPRLLEALARGFRYILDSEDGKAL